MMMKSFSPRQRLLFGLGAFLLLVNLFLMNDIATVWDGAESQLFWSVLHGEDGLALPVLGARLFSGGAMHSFWMRLPGPLLFLFTIPAVFFILRPVLGASTVGWMLLVLGSSFLLPNTVKLATADSWAFAFHFLGFSFLLSYLKKPAFWSRWGFYLILLPALWTAPLSSILLFSILPGLLYWLHPQGRRMWRLQPWGLLLVVGGAFYGAGMMDGVTDLFYFGFQPGRYLMFNLLGMLPFFGFLLAGLMDMVGKARRRGELALISLSGVLAALCSQSLLLQGVFALLIARHLHLYFQKNYPFRDLVRTVSILHLVALFFGAIALMMGGFLRFEGVGFRAGLAVSVPYWMASFLVVIGLFGMNRRFVWGGTVMGGLLATLLFWAQWYPLWEEGRRLPQQLARRAADMKEVPEAPLNLWVPGDDYASNELLYARQYFSRVNTFRDTSAVESWYERQEPGIFALPQGTLLPAAVSQDTVILQGIDDRFQRVTWVLFARR